jgi:SP family general alpha glucoside:H+ symporter-like MFS transporter
VSISFCHRKRKFWIFVFFRLFFSAASQSILKQITKAGQLVGLGATGWVVDRIGYKWTMLGALVGIVPIVFMQFFAPNKEVLIAAQFLIGIPLAPFLTLSNVSLG